MDDAETLFEGPRARVDRRGRFAVAELRAPHRVLSGSARNGGLAEHVRYVVNHQSCEGTGHLERYRAVTAQGEGAYHDAVCAELGLPAGETAVLGTAANLSYLALAAERDAAVGVVAAVTAGVQTNAVCAGDAASWREEPGAAAAVPVHGTINTVLLIDHPVTAAALARAVVTMTEAKTAALQRLAVPSCYSEELATGTGTDQYAVAAPIDGPAPLTSASPHVKLGELIGRAVRDATLEALRWQNGLEPSYTRGLFHALGRYGVSEATFVEDLAPHLGPDDLELLRRNLKSVVYEPLVGAAAHALAAVLDRVRHGTLPASVAADAAAQQGALLAAGLAAQPGRWPAFRRDLHAAAREGPKALVLAAVALGWREKWRPS
jgi:adenosylcobinamide amidohydrolase